MGVRYVFGLTSDHVLTLELDLDLGAFVIDRLLVLGRGWGGKECGPLVQGTAKGKWDEISRKVRSALGLVGRTDCEENGYG